MEYIDVLDEKGNKTGEIKSKDEVHEKGLWHRSVHIWLANTKGEILLQLRSKTKRTYPGVWDISAAGHISAGESSLESANRELQEEIGVDIPEEDYVFIGEVIQSVVINDGTYINNEFNDVYVVRRDIDISDFKFNDGEVERVEWVSKEKFRQMTQDKDANLVSHSNEYNLLLDFLA